MVPETPEQALHDLDATLRVGKGGIESVAEELSSQLQSERFVKVKFLRSALGGTSTDEQAEALADLASAEVAAVRGHTALFTR